MYSISKDHDFSDLDIYKFYLPDFKIGKAMFSPVRKEKTPSFYIFKARDGKYRWKDFGFTGKSGNAVNLVMELFNLTYKGAKEKLLQDLSGVTLYLGLPPKVLVEPKPSIIDIKIKSKPFTVADLKYWSMFGINQQTLNKFMVYSISHYWINNKLIYIPKNQLSFAYYLSGKWKIYSPYSKIKWITNGNSYTIQGASQLVEKGELLVLSKALKDVMILDSFGIPAIAPQSESVLLDRSIMISLFKRFDNIVTFFDSDLSGINLAKKYYDEYHISGLEVPKNCCAKDLGEYVVNFGLRETEELLKHLALIY